MRYPYRITFTCDTAFRSYVSAVAEGADDGVAVLVVDADVAKALPAVAGRALVGSVTASSGW